MVVDEPKVSPTGRYSIGQAADILGVHRNTLRRHTNTGPTGITCQHRKSNGRKFYTGLEIVKFWKAQM